MEPKYSKKYGWIHTVTLIEFTRPVRNLQYQALCMVSHRLEKVLDLHAIVEECVVITSNHGHTILALRYYPTIHTKPTFERKVSELAAKFYGELQKFIM